MIAILLAAMAVVQPGSAVFPAQPERGVRHYLFTRKRRPSAGT